MEYQRSPAPDSAREQYTLERTAKGADSYLACVEYVGKRRDQDIGSGRRVPGSCCIANIVQYSRYTTDLNINLRYGITVVLLDNCYPLRQPLSVRITYI